MCGLGVLRPPIVFERIASKMGSEPQIRVPLIIDGVDVFLPDQKLAFTPQCSVSDGVSGCQTSAQGADIASCHAAVESSARAFKLWSRTSTTHRRRLLLGLANLLKSKEEDIRTIIEEEIHATSLWSHINFQDSILMIEEAASLTTSPTLSGTIPASQDPESQVLILTEPLGVILGIAPWNSPLILGFRSVLPAIATGNTAILKGSELSPRVHYFVAALFREAGFPPGVCNFLLHRAEDAVQVFDTIIERPEIRKCNFTGSTAVGRSIASKASRALKPCLLELGGKNFAIVLEDADLEKAANMVAEGAFLNNGQICMSTDTCLIATQVFSKFREALISHLQKPGSTLQMTNLITATASSRIAHLITDAAAKGATLHTAVLEHDAESENAEHRANVPTVVEGVTPEMDIYSQETFGPLLSIIPIETTDEAVAIVNECKYGLSAAVHSRDHYRALSLAKELQVGAVHINGATVHDESTLPHGGYRDSGWGRFGAGPDVDTGTITCDGARPKCSACNELSFDCVYIQSASSSNVIVGKEYLTGLEERLKVVEENILSLQTSQSRQQQHLRFEEVDELAPNDAHGGNTNGELLPLTNNMRPPDGPETPHVITLEDETNELGTVIFSVEEDSGFFGPSSNIALNRHVSRTVLRLSRTHQTFSNITNTESQRLHAEIGIMSASRPSSPGPRSLRLANSGGDETAVNIYRLPTEERTCELISRYFSDTGLLFPYIHEGTFWESYDEMKSSNFTRTRRSWLGLLNIIMALATSTTIDTGSSAEERLRESDIYYQRAMGLCEKQMMRGTSFEIVQFLLVMGQYLQGTQRSVETWSIHGLAVKAAMQLGLHCPKVSGHLSPLVQEYRKRTWYGCVVLDRTLSMTFGRPSAIPDDYIVLDLPCNVGMSNPSGVMDPKTVASLGFFNATITLYKIMWNVIQTAYGGNLGSESNVGVVERITRIFPIEQQLVDWKRRLPPNLALQQAANVAPSPALTVDSQDFFLEKFRVILTLRHHNLRVLLHRPILVSFLDLAGNNSLQDDAETSRYLEQFGGNSVQICVQSSIEIISLISTIVSSTGLRRTWLGAWWFTLYYTFNAALVLFATLLVVQSRHSDSAGGIPLLLSPAEMQRALLEASSVLRRLDTENRTIKRCTKYVERLIEVLRTLAATSDSFMPLPPDLDPFSSGEFHFGNNGNETFAGLSGPSLSDTSPLGMELGEFILEEDMEFMNQLFALGATTGNTPGLASRAALGYDPKLAAASPAINGG
ncbi:hypothetical protein V498_06095 [Pseudogymnoascus sp. VKM F-4517 (FW-2822)]|nr:hypothetical protein V498_06095 [Pseudogymnoascus sp. VKM F-4517 (FW-2822)]